jgi:hypothetical protein
MQLMHRFQKTATIFDVVNMQRERRQQPRKRQLLGRLLPDEHARHRACAWYRTVTSHVDAVVDVKHLAFRPEVNA